MNFYRFTNTYQKKIMALYFLFDDMRYNLLLYFSILTIILEIFGHEKIMPSLKKINAAPVVQTPSGDLGGILMSTKYGRNIHAYKGEVSDKVWTPLVGMLE